MVWNRGSIRAQLMPIWYQLFHVWNNLELDTHLVSNSCTIDGFVWLRHTSHRFSTNGIEWILFGVCWVLDKQRTAGPPMWNVTRELPAVSLPNGVWVHEPAKNKSFANYFKKNILRVKWMHYRVKLHSMEN